MEKVKYVSKEDLKFAYEQSILAYQKHVERYSTWMNMYAVMTGALFVAFYSIYGKDSTYIICSKLNEICHCSLVSDDNAIFLLLIALLGLICSLCWYGSVKGHYEWMKSFIGIVKNNEKKYFGENGPFVYSKVIASETSKPKKGNFLYGFFSTQKITLFFIKGVVLAWIFCLVLVGLNSVCLAKGMVVLFILLCIIFLMSSIIQKSILNYFLSTILPNEILTKDIKL